MSCTDCSECTGFTCEKHHFTCNRSFYVTQFVVYSISKIASYGIEVHVGLWIVGDGGGY